MILLACARQHIMMCLVVEENCIHQIKHRDIIWLGNTGCNLNERFSMISRYFRLYACVLGRDFSRHLQYVYYITVFHLLQ